MQVKLAPALVDAAVKFEPPLKLNNAHFFYLFLFSRLAQLNCSIANPSPGVVTAIQLATSRSMRAASKQHMHLVCLLAD